MSDFSICPIRHGRQLLGVIISVVLENSVSITIVCHHILPEEAAAKLRSRARMAVARGVG